jgi:hypothetical protein
MTRIVEDLAGDWRRQAAERGADIIIAQGGESGGYAGEVSTMALVPQVVDAVAPIPVVVAGGIFDGRDIAAALMLGVAGFTTVCCPPEFGLDSFEAGPPFWVSVIVESGSLVRVWDCAKAGTAMASTIEAISRRFIVAPWCCCSTTRITPHRSPQFKTVGPDNT